MSDENQNNEEEKVIERDVYFEPKDECDVLLHVGDGDKKQTFHCHSLILEMASSVFTDMLGKATENEAKMKELNFESKNPEHFLMFLKLLYPIGYDLRKETGDYDTPTIYYEGDVEYMKEIRSVYENYIYYPFYLLQLAEEFQVDPVFDELDGFMACFQPDRQTEEYACLQHLIFCDQYPDKLPCTYAKCLAIFRKYKNGLTDKRGWKYLKGQTVAELLKERFDYHVATYRGETRKNDTFYKDDAGKFTDRVFTMFQKVELKEKDY